MSMEQVHREAVKRFHEGRRQDSEAANEPPTIHYSELLPASPESPIFQEVAFYRREVGRLLADGHEGKFVLIKGERLIGIFDTLDNAHEFAVRNCPMQPCLIKQVLTREPLIGMSRRFWQCRS